MAALERWQPVSRERAPLVVASSPGFPIVLAGAVLCYVHRRCRPADRASVPDDDDDLLTGRIPSPPTAVAWSVRTAPRDGMSRVHRLDISDCGLVRVRRAPLTA
jgi:hypothetical protein